MAKDKDYVRLINAARWRRLRAQVLAEQPICEDCTAQGLVHAATEVHHITPVESAPDFAGKERLAYSRANLRALCHSCHVAAHVAMGRSGREANERRNAEKLESIKKRFFS